MPRSSGVTQTASLVSLCLCRHCRLLAWGRLLRWVPSCSLEQLLNSRQGQGTWSWAIWEIVSSPVTRNLPEPLWGTPWSEQSDI